MNQSVKSLNKINKSHLNKTMDKIVIRSFKNEDLKTVTDIYLRIIKEEFPWAVNKNISSKDFKSSIDGECIIVATINETIVGFISIWEADKFIHNLFIAKDFRGLGVAKKLLEEAVKIWGTPLTLKCVKENIKAVEFYINNGWECVKEELGSEGPYYLMRRI